MRRILKDEILKPAEHKKGGTPAIVRHAQFAKMVKNGALDGLSGDEALHCHTFGVKWPFVSRLELSGIDH
jgi:hypothetical protein